MSDEGEESFVDALVRDQVVVVEDEDDIDLGRAQLVDEHREHHIREIQSGRTRERERALADLGHDRP
jgi:hypothetical protein